MTLIKKSDVHRHLSTKSRENRDTQRPYGVVNPAPGKAEPAVAPAGVTKEAPIVVPGHETAGS
jgi:hypothetical protein